MKEKINIADILKDKPVGLKFYSNTFGYISFNGVHKDKVYFFSEDNNAHSVKPNGKMYDGGECIIFPSKEMRDWEKFSWKKGDALIMNGCRVVFDKWLNDDYTRFNAVHLITFFGGYFDKPLQNRYTPISKFITKYWRKMTDLETKIYMESLERECGGKLNLTTLNIEKQLEFKDGDIVVAEEDNYYDKVIFIAAIKDTIVSKALINVRYEDYEVHYNEYRFGRNRSLRLATDSEKRQLFDALAKEGKAWNAETKTLEYLPKKCEFKPFDKVLVRNTDTEEWFPGFFEKFDSTWNNPYHIMNRRSMTDFAFKQCISYEGNEHLLGTTKDVED